MYLTMYGLAPGQARHGPQSLLRRHRLLRHDQRPVQPARAHFRADLAQVLAPGLLFGSGSLTLMFSSLMVSTATIILGGIPAAIYERFVGAKDDSTEASLWIWLAGTAILTLPAIGNFFQIGL